MKTNFTLLFALFVAVAIISTGCKNVSNEKKDSAIGVEKEEHIRDLGEGGEGEEDGTQYAKESVCDIKQKETHLILRYDAESNAFIGTVENISDDLIENVRVEVHLSNGLELGPTTPVDLKPGGKVEINIPASEKEFESWSTHSEIGNSEHSHGEGEHSHEGENEHSHDGEHSHEGENEHSHDEGEIKINK